MPRTLELLTIRPDSESPPPVRLEFLGSSRKTEALSLWRNLEDRFQHRRLASSFPWTDAWLTHYGPRVPHRFALGLRGDEPIGLCLVTESREPPFGPVAIRTYHLGTAGERDEESLCIEHNSLLVLPEHRLDFANELQSVLTSERGCDAVAWDGFDPCELPTKSAGAPDRQLVVKPTFLFDLQRARRTGIDPIQLLGVSTRRAIRQNLRGLDSLYVDWSETPAQAESIFHELVQWHQMRWQSAGHPGSFASPAFCEFHSDVSQRLVPLGRAALVRVRSGRQTVGCTLLYIERNHALVYQIGWNPQLDSLKSPGLVNDFCCLSECLRRGFDALDFMAGESVHKKRLTTDRGCLAWATYSRPTWKSRTLQQLRSTKRYLQSLYQNSSVPPRPSQPSESLNAETSSAEEGER